MSHTFKRREIRERVLKILYAHSMNNESLATITDGILSDVVDKEDKEFAKNLVNSVTIHREEINELIAGKVQNWEMGRIAIIDKILLQMATAELLYFPDIPPKVSINEAIEIAKVYSTAASGKFINGILDALLSDFVKSNSLNKKGRGLIDTAIQKPKKS